MATFTVDTHLFRELGELLVGRVSTALVELIKNAYDADATVVTLFGEHLDKPAQGRIVITDDGTGMTEDAFTNGFLRIASRIKEHEARRSTIYRRRFTGAKGIGRLAAHKLARRMAILSVPDPEAYSGINEAISASIDWDKIESLETLDEIDSSGAVSLRTEQIDETPGTEIELTGLRRKWTAAERTRVIREIATFQPPEVLSSIPNSVHAQPLLFERPIIRDVAKQKSDPGFAVQLEGEFDVGDEFGRLLPRPQTGFSRSGATLGLEPSTT